MTTTRHVARASGSTGSTLPPYRVDIHADGHALTGDEPPQAGGGDLGPSPFGLMLAGLVACTATTLRMYAERKGWSLSSIDVEVRYDIGDDGQASIQRTITLPHDLPAEQRDALAGIAERTPVTRAIRNGTPIATTLKTAVAH